jgi:hypothetical protein
MHDNPGHDATPGYCALCEEDGADLIDTIWGPMHPACAASEPKASSAPDYRAGSELS